MGVPKSKPKVAQKRGHRHHGGYGRQVVLVLPEDSRVAKVLTQVNKVLKKVNDMGLELDDLTAQVAETKTVMKSAVVLIQGLREAIIEAGTDPVKLKELTDGLKEDEDALSAAVSNEPPV